MEKIPKKIPKSIKKKTKKSKKMSEMVNKKFKNPKKSFSSKKCYFERRKKIAKKNAFFSFFQY